MAYFLNGQALVRKDEGVAGVIIKGIDPQEEIRVNSLGQYIKKGSLDNLQMDGIVIGSELANKLNVDIGSTISLISPAFP